jgi:predicted permease
MQTLWQDIRYGLRVMWKSPGFTAVAVVTLALGVGAGTAIFSGVSAFMLRPLSGISEPSRVVMLFESSPGDTFDDFSYLNYRDYREQTDAFDGLLAHSMVQAAIGDESQTDVVWGELVSANFFDVLRVQMEKGRGFLPEEEGAVGASPVVVLGHHLWRERYEADPEIVGKTIQLSGRAYTVVGVAGEEFAGSQWALRMDFFVPLTMQQQLTGRGNWLAERGDSWLELMGRLKDGVTQEQAAAGMTAIARRLEEQYPDQRRRDGSVTVMSELEGRWEELGGTARMSGALALAVVALVLLIVCANIANLLLARAASRRREIGIRLALGAGRWRIMRQLLTESLLLALTGGALGLLLAFWLTDMMMTFVPVLPYALVFTFTPDTRALLFTLGVSVACGVLFGLAPALQASQPDLIPVLKGEEGDARRGQGRRRLQARHMLVVAQVALSLVVLTCAGLLVRSFRNAKAIDTGMAADNVVAATVSPGLLGYTREQGRELYRQVIERAETLAGVESASAASLLPLGDSSNSWGPIYAAEQGPPPPNEGWNALVNIVAPRYFQTLGIQLLRGRDFDERDRDGAAVEAAVINETLAARLWPGEDPLGRRLKVGRTEPFTLEVVGVARNGKYRTLGESPRPMLYLSSAQSYAAGMTVVVRTKGDPEAYAEGLRQMVRSVDARVPVSNLKTMREHLTWAFWAQRMGASLASFFGLLALALAATGLYSVVAYSVSRRTHEIGIRMALGAQGRDILRMIAQQGMRLTVVGLALGLAAAYAASRVMAGLLFGVSSADPVIFIGIPLALAAVALVASYLPARRATKVDPMVALRHE